MVIGKLSELLVAGHGFLEAATTSPRSPLDLKLPSSTSKRYDLNGVGLGIVTAMDRSGDSRARCVVSNPIAIDRLLSSPECSDDDEEEDYTFVTRRGPNNETFTKVFYDGGRTGPSPRKGIFNVAAASSFDDDAKMAKSASGFLSACDLCRKKLHGKDIFMYRGEKAFCSSECRASHMMMDERKEQCRIEASKSTVNASNSPYARGQIFSTGIMAI